jgi:hypothetical protein
MRQIKKFSYSDISLSTTASLRRLRRHELPRTNLTSPLTVRQTHNSSSPTSLCERAEALEMAFLDLPNELVIIIIKYLYQPDIYAIIRVNRRLCCLFAEYLLQYNVRYRSGTALTWAVFKGHESLARELVRLGADVNRLIKFRTPQYKIIQFALLHLAAMRGDLAAVKFLFQIGADPNVRDGLSRVPLYWALKAKHEDTILEISNKIADFPDFLIDIKRGLTPLHLACRLGLINVLW